MAENQGKLWKGNLRFFGKATASMSHEIKNALAIIGESAGLIEDLILMSEKGVELKAEKLKQICERVQNQTVRADLIVRRLNTFSHSSDELLKTVDLLELVQLVTSLARRFSSLRGVDLEMIPEAKSVSITTDPFSLENLLWRSLDFATARTDDDKLLHINVTDDPAGGKISISGMKSPMLWPDPAFPGEEEWMLISHLRASFEAEKQGGRLFIGLPGKLEAI